MRECKATFYKKNIRYDIYGTGLPILGAGLRHLMDRTLRGFEMYSKVRQINYVVDVGANMGYMALAYHLAFPDAKVLAIEPSSYNIKYLLKNTEGIESIEILQVAAASENSELEIALPTKEQRKNLAMAFEDWDNSGAISVFGKTDRYRERVKGVKLDDVVNQKVDYLKLDIEGSELSALKGAHRILTEDKPFIQVEIRPENLAMAGLEPRDIHLFILEYGYLRTGSYQADLIYAHKDHFLTEGEKK